MNGNVWLLFDLVSVRSCALGEHSTLWLHWLLWNQFGYWIARTVLGSVRYTGSRCTVLILFYYRKSNWSARLHTPPLPSLYRVATPVRGSLFRDSTGLPPLLGFRRIPRSEYKSRRPLSRALPWIVRTARSLSLMKKLVEMLHRLYPRPSS